MEYLAPSEIAVLWKVSTSLVRRYLRRGQIPGAFLEDGSWKIPVGTVKPGTYLQEEETPPDTPPLLKKLLYQQKRNNHYGIYEYLQLNMAYSSNRMASNRLTRQQVELIHRAHRIIPNFEPIKVDDILEVVNHLHALDYVLSTCLDKLTPDYIKRVHGLLTYGTFFELKRGQGGGILRTEAVKVRRKTTISPNFILKSLRTLALNYEKGETDLTKILDFHVQFENIHPFPDYNGRVGRLIMLKECLRHGIDPFIIDDKRRSAYHRGISLWAEDPSVLTSVVLQAQSRFQNQMDTCNSFEYCRPANPRRKM